MSQLIIPAMTLDVMISTFGAAGLDKVSAMNLPETDGVRYVVSWQTAHNYPVPASLRRDDVRIFPHDSIGLSRNRNECMAHCTSDICLVADDDLTYTSEQLLKVIEAFRNRSDADIILFRFKSPETKYYPSEAYRIVDKPVRNHYVNEIEIAFRRESVAGKVRFNELMGLNAPVIHAGEGEMFVFTALRKGLRCYYEPEVITLHEGMTTTSTRKSDSGVIMAKGVMNYLYNPHTWLPRMIVNALRMHRRGYLKFNTAFRSMWNGMRYCKRYFNSYGEVVSIDKG